MGTNYYLRKPACECCGHVPEDVHIGKSSAGWMFMFAADNVINFATLVESLSNHPDWVIVNEYGEKRTHLEFVGMVLRKQSGGSGDDVREDGFRYLSGDYS